MKEAKLGTRGLHTSRLGLGCMGMSEFYGAFKDNESINVIHRALDLGITFLDTADMYGPFINEELVGKALKGHREGVTLATKFGFQRELHDPTSRRVNGRPEYVKQACDASLSRLQVDVIDLYYLHRKDPNVPIEDTVGAMGELVKAGKVKALGLSEVSSATLRKAHAVHPISALQTEYSLWSRDPEEGTLQTCRELGIAFVAYSPLGRGFLAGKIRKFEDLEENDVRRRWPRFQDENFQKNIVVLEKITEFAKRKKCTLSQLALAWVLAQGEDVFAIPGTKHMRYLEENAGAINIRLSSEELREIDDLSPKDVAAGARYPEMMMGLVNQ